MIDALLHAVVDNLRSGNFGLDRETCRIMPDGKPTPNCGGYFVAVHQGSSSSRMDNALDEYFGFAVTPTMRVTIPIDRVGDQLEARRLSKITGFNARCNALIAFLHMAWGVLQDANNVLLEIQPDTPALYGFCEPARFRGMDIPALVGGEWFSAEPEAADVGLKAELRFEDARRMQPIATYT